MATLVLVLRTVALLCFAAPMLAGAIGRRSPSGTEPHQRLGARAPVAANFAAFVAFLISLLAFSASLDGALALLMASAGSLLAVVGAVLVLWSRTALGPAWSLVPIADRATGFITTGPYRLVRHPIYLGLALVAMGNAIAFANPVAALTVLCGVVPTFAWRARAEEAVLSQTFGACYADYQARTRMIVPHVL